jgi:ribulose-phosphate 3-epimerase
MLGVYPGFGGQAIQPGMQERIASVRQLLDRMGRNISIAVDGGVKPENAASLVQAGADLLIMGTALFQSEDMAETVKAVRKSVAWL